MKNSQPIKNAWAGALNGSFGSDFNVDLGVSFTADEITYNYRKQPYIIDELAGVSVFFKNDKNEIFHTYSTYSRGTDILNGAYNYIDLSPKGRNEEGGIMNWLRRHDQY